MGTIGANRKQMRITTDKRNQASKKVQKTGPRYNSGSFSQHNQT